MTVIGAGAVPRLGFSFGGQSDSLSPTPIPQIVFWYENVLFYTKTRSLYFIYFILSCMLL